MAAWIWLVLGLGLMALELIAPGGFFMLLLGLSGLVVGGLGLMGAAESLGAQTAVFSGTALVLWLGLGKRLRTLTLRQKSAPSQLVGRRVVVSGEILPAAHGSGELYGSPWRLQNVGDVVIANGAEAEVVAAEGVTLQVRAVR